MQKDYDIIIIGTGAGGETLADAASTGKRNLRREDFEPYYTQHKTVSQKILANNFNFGSSEDEKPRASAQMGKHKWEMMRSDFPRWVFNSRLKVFASHSKDSWMQSENLSNVENRVEIAKNQQIKVYYHPNKEKVHLCLQHQFKKVLRQAGFPIKFGISMLLKIINHQGGTCRAGK